MLSDSAKKSFIGHNKSIWGPLELVEKLCPESVNIATSARDMPGIKYAIKKTYFYNKTIEITAVFNCTYTVILVCLFVFS